MLKHLKLLAWFQIDVKCIVMKSNARIRSEAHPGVSLHQARPSPEICRSTLWFWIQTLSPPSNFHLFQDLCEFGNLCLHWVKILAQLGEAEVQELATQCPAE